MNGRVLAALEKGFVRATSVSKEKVMLVKSGQLGRTERRKSCSVLYQTDRLGRNYPL